MYPLQAGLSGLHVKPTLCHTHTHHILKCNHTCALRMHFCTCTLNCSTKLPASASCHARRVRLLLRVWRRIR